MLEWKYDINASHERGERGNRFNCDVGVVSLSMSGKVEGIGLVGPHTKEEGEP